jgi:DNA-binding MarR family transcriptional regulator
MARQTLESATNDLIQSIGLLVRRVRAAAASHELSLTESSVLRRLEIEGPATTADLARAESVKPQSMGATVAALDERGFVERKPHPTDGRQFNIAITAKGLAIRNSARTAKRHWLAEAIAQLDDDDRETLRRASAIIQRLAAK